MTSNSSAPHSPIVMLKASDEKGLFYLTRRFCKT